MKVTSVVTTIVYPKIKASMDKNSNAFKKCVGRFISSRYDQIYDIGPTHRIYFGKSDLEDFYKSIKISGVEIDQWTKGAYWWANKGFNPPCAREAFTIAMICIIKYYLEKKNQKDAELASIYLAFSGSFYASVHGKSFNTFPPKKECMDYVVNYKLSNKFTIKTEGTLFGAMRLLCITWLSKYGDLIRGNFDDDDFRLIVQQLRDRESALVKAIANVYYPCYENKEYFNYESENVDGDNGESFRLTDNDSLRISGYVEKVLNTMTQQSVDYRICKDCADANVKADEIRFIMESIIKEKAYLDDIRDTISIILTNFYVNKPGCKVSSIDFLSYSMTLKPNSKDEGLIRMKEHILKWLTEKSPNYIRRKKRPDTANSYYKSVLYYFCLTIHKVVK